LTNRYGKLNKIQAYIGGGILCALAFFFKKMVTSPVLLLYTPGIGELLPPLWILNTLGYAACFAIGACLCTTLLSECSVLSEAVTKYRGCVYLILAVVGGFSWYFLLFDARLVLLSWGVSMISLMSMVITAFLWRRIFKACSILLFLAGLWWLYILILQLIVMLHI